MKVLQKHFWFSEPHKAPLPTDREIVVDCFAGGGGASLGIQRAIGRQVDVAINHDPSAVAMHMANHADTRHWQENLWNVDPRDVCGDAPVGLAWFSPDCTHFSKAKGGKPHRKTIRSLAWLVVRWAARVRPRVIFVENVEEFVTWGPLRKGKPCKRRKGITFAQWCVQLRELGYAVEWRNLKACDYGAPTTRKRLFVVARCDGEPIVWPEQTHASPAAIRKRLKSHQACNWQEWRTAAEIIDWSISCPSIFLSPAEAKARGCRRPLAEKTLKRIAEGIRRYVIETADPFIVRVNHGGTHFRGQPRSKPLGTITAHNGYGLVTPFVSAMYGASVGRGAVAPLQTATRQNKSMLVTPTLVQTGYGERQGQSPRCLDMHKPLGTVVASGKHAVIAPILSAYYGPRPGDNGHRGRKLDSPIATQTTENRFALVSAFIAKHFGGMVGVRAETPFPTVTQRGTQNQVVAAHVTKMNYGDKPCTGAGEPLHTVVAQGTTHAITTSHLLKLYGTSHGQPVDSPMHTVTSNGNHVGEVRAFLCKYYGSGGQWSPIDSPMPTITVRDRLMLGIVMVGGEPYQIVDIGMRMLTPRELFRAQGFPDSYDVETGINGIPATKGEQVARCGNSVCPDVVEALVRANY